MVTEPVEVSVCLSVKPATGLLLAGPEAAGGNTLIAIS
jgi:hypothetical protein